MNWYDFFREEIIETPKEEITTSDLPEESRTESQNIDKSNEDKSEETTEPCKDEVPSSEKEQTSKEPKTDSPIKWSQKSMLALSRKFNIDLTAKVRSFLLIY